MISKKAGDSLWLNVTGQNLEVVDPTWANWSGRWAIIDDYEARNVLASGNLERSADFGVFRIRAGASTLTGVPAGCHFLVVEVSNATMDYLQEVASERLRVTPQGLV